MTYEFLVLTNLEPPAPPPIPQPANAMHLIPGPIKALVRKADRGQKPLKLQIYEQLLVRNMAIGDIVDHFRSEASQSKVYGAVANLRAQGLIHVVTRQVRERANGSGPMMRDVYGPTIATQELQL